MSEEDMRELIEKVKSKPLKATVIVLLIVVAAFGLSGFYKNSPGEGSIEFNAVTSEYQFEGEGWQWRLPIAAEVEQYNVKVQKDTVEADAVSKDQLPISVKATVSWHIQSSDLQFIRQNYGTLQQLKNRVVDPGIQDISKSCTKQYTSDVLLGRLELRTCMEEELTTWFAEGEVVLDQVAIENVALPEVVLIENERKEATRQKNVTAQIELDIARTEAQQQIVRAEGEAKSASIIGESVAEYGDAYLFLQWVEAWMAGGSKVPTTLVTSGEGDTPFLLTVGTSPEQEVQG